MTEAEWQIATDPTPMLELIRDKVSERKIRLFAAACCRRIWHHLSDERCRWAVTVVERYADRLATPRELLETNVAVSIVEDAEHDAAYPDQIDHPDDWSFAVCCDASAAASAVERTTSDWPIGMSAAEHRAKHLPGSPPTIATDSVCVYAQQALAHAASPLRYDFVQWVDTPERARIKSDEAVAQSRLAVDIFGPFHFRNVPIDPVWISSAVIVLAQGIYDDRAFDRLPILADALQDAGCENSDILDHCRGEGPHVRGCWVVDLILGKM